MQAQQIEELVTKIQSLQRDGLIHMLRNLDCDFAIDFTDEFLNTISVERLRHIILAAALHARSLNGSAA